MFQIIISKILQNLINAREVVRFIDNMIVEIKEEERYDKVVEEVVKRIVENNLYVKIKAVLDWLTPNEIKNIQNFWDFVTNFILYNQQINSYKLSYTGKPQMRAIYIYVGCTKATTNDSDIRPSVAVKALSANIS